MSKPTYKELEKRVREFKKAASGYKKKSVDLEQDVKEWRETFDSITDIVTLISPNHEFIKINKAGCLATGKTEDELRGKKCYEIIHNTNKPIKECPCVKSLKSKKAAVSEFSENGRHYIATASPILDKNKELIAFSHTVKDITGRKNTEEALYKLTEEQQLILDSVPAAIWFKDTKNRILRVNKLGADSIGMKVEDIEGKTAYELFPDEAEHYYEDDMEVLSSRVPKLGIVEQLQISSGEKIWVQTDKVPYFDEKGNVAGLVAFVVDITQRKQLEGQLQIRQRMDSLGTLAGGIAHDFNNILVGIMGNIDLLNMDNDNFTEYQKACLSEADKNCVRAANLIRQFQTLSIGTVRGKSAVDIYDISNEVFNLLKETTDRLITKQIKFKKGEFFVTADSGELHQALLNLATNSAHAIEERGVKKGDYIRINAEDYEAASGDRTGLDEGNYIHISFEDNGAGMSGEVLKKAFDPLFTTKRLGVKKGQGLGLAMVYNIVTRIYKGRIYIDSEHGKGTTFHIYLPKAQSEAEDKGKRTIEMIGGTETILVVDDEETIRKLTIKLLTQIGYTVITADDGKEALKIFNKQKDSIDAVILDLTMPQMSGKQVFQMMLDINPDVKVIISSGHGDEYSKEGILGRAKGSVGKPYRLKDLAGTLRKVLDI